MTARTRKASAVFAVTLALIAGVIAYGLAGCGGVPTSPPPFHPNGALVTIPINKAATGSAKVQAHLESAERAVKAVVEVAPPAEKPLLKVVSEEHAAATEALTKEVNPQLEQAIREKAIADAQAVAATNDRDKVSAEWAAKYAALEDHWYVRWGRWLEHAFWIVVLTWAGLGIASILLGLGNPLGWLASASGFILHLIPFGNIFAWFRTASQWFWDRLQLGRQQIAAGAIPPRLVNIASPMNGPLNVAAATPLAVPFAGV